MFQTSSSGIVSVALDFYKIIRIYIMKFEGAKDGQLLDDIFTGRKTFYALSGI